MVSKTVFIDGEAGTTGLGIRARLEAIPEITLLHLPEGERKENAARRAAMAAADLVILCLPDQAAREAVALATDLRADLGADAPRLLDASTAHRTAPGWVYGFPELAAGQAAAIAGAALVANPGCYATGAIALLRPLVEAGLIAPDMALSIHAVSGYSGGGRMMIAAHEAAGGPAFELYALGLEHKHVPEIIRYAGLAQRPLFVPAVGHFRQGMLVSIPLFLDTLPGRPAAADLRAALARHYRDAALITVSSDGTGDKLAAETPRESDRMTLHVFAHERHRQAVLVAHLDNLGKGASGAAVQNARLMLGLPALTQDAKELADVR